MRLVLGIFGGELLELKPHRPSAEPFGAELNINITQRQLDVTMLLRPRALPALSRLAKQSHHNARSFGFASKAGSEPTMDYIPMPYIEETSVS